MARFKERQLAIALRKQGHTYREILDKIPKISKGTLSYWCNQIKLTPEETKRVENRATAASERGRMIAAETNHRRKFERDQLAIMKATKLFEKYKSDPLFILGVSLYWGEGTKKGRRFQFTNSDPEMISVIVKWLNQYADIPTAEIKPRLYIHKSNRVTSHEKFWVEYLGIPKSNLLKTVSKNSDYDFATNENYKGCLRIDVGDVNLWVMMMAWQKMLVESLKI